MRKHVMVAACAAAVVFGQQSSATITVTVSPTWAADVDLDDLGNNQWVVKIRQKTDSVASGILITGDDPNDVIQEIEVYNDSPGLAIMSINISDGDSGKTDIGGLGGLWVDSPSTTYVDFTDLKITGDLGIPGGTNTMAVNRASWIEIDGDWRMNLTIDRNTGTSDNNLLVIYGDMLGGSIYNNIGSISGVQVAGDIIGSASDPIEIWAKTSIGLVSADSITHARIGSQTAGFSGYSQVGAIYGYYGGLVSDAPMTVASLDLLALNGDYDADITVLGAMASDALYEIRDTFEADGVLSLPANGLAGQIRINRNNLGGQFLGDVEVGAVTLAPNYANLSHTLGGGAVGVAPFNFHQFTGPAPTSRADLDCNPYHTETVRVGDCEEITDLAEVIIDHYGPIYVNGAGPHFRVEYRPDFLPASWSNVTGQFETDTTQTATADGFSNRKAFLKPASTNTTHFNSSGLFRVRPIAGKVKSSGVFGNSDVVYDSSITSGDLGSTSGTQYDWYQFRVRLTLCGGMTVFEGGQVNAADIAAWPDDPFEVNRDGRADAQDLAVMMDAYNP